MKLIPCPHCNRAFDAQGLHAHTVACIQRPGVPDLVQQLLERPDAPGCARSAREYAQAAIAHNAQPGFGLRAPSQRALDEGLGGWRAVCAWAGLEYTRAQTESGAAREAAAIAEVDALLEADAELRETWRERGLPVMREYMRLGDKQRVYCELR